VIDAPRFQLLPHIFGHARMDLTLSTLSTSAYYEIKVAAIEPEVVAAVLNSGN